MTDWQYAFALEQELEAAEELLAARVLDELPEFKLTLEIGAGIEQEAVGLTAHQFSQLLQVAQQSESVAVVINYLRYQIGRSKSPDNQGWRYAEVGQILIQHLNDLQRMARNVAQKAVERTQGRTVAATPEQRDQAWIALARLFLAMVWRSYMLRDNEQKREAQA